MMEKNREFVVVWPIEAHERDIQEITRGTFMEEYYEKKDLEDFENIGEYAPALGQRYFDYYGEAMKAGSLSEREKVLIALVVATTEKCPYCIDAYTNQCLSLGISREEMMEAVHVGAAMVAGTVLAHSTQMRKIIKKKEM
ncbi:MAG: Carboxymuconolactone decarboxylase family protein [Syntrophorhabdus sp. PtaU1.Bin002]|nr:MAG: Carboxymuconolactone decarboxylase family protein [Syntrophorhabdus sp. PtaU1.Bin002]